MDLIFNENEKIVNGTDSVVIIFHEQNIDFDSFAWTLLLGHPMNSCCMALLILDAIAATR
jgi:hypothetical protein